LREGGAVKEIGEVCVGVSMIYFNIDVVADTERRIKELGNRDKGDLHINTTHGNKCRSIFLSSFFVLKACHSASLCAKSAAKACSSASSSCGACFEAVSS
jgi:hypothetical protein